MNNGMRLSDEVAGDGITGIKRRRRDLSSDGVRNMAMASGRGRLKEDLESSMYTAKGIIKLPVKSLQLHIRNTRDLDSIWEEMRQDCNFTQSGFKNMRTMLRDGVAIPSDVVRTYKRRRQEIFDGVRT
ncbi:hypothetical protein Tco_1290909 [Tanacetum coccineum]